MRTLLSALKLVTALNSNFETVNRKALTVTDERYVNANSSTTFTLSNASEVGFLYANNGNGSEYAWVVGARNQYELGISPIAGESSYITITKNGLSFEVACTYTTRVQFVKGAN